jgi:hypothetical protein
MSIYAYAHEYMHTHPAGAVALENTGSVRFPPSPPPPVNGN